MTSLINDLVSFKQLKNLNDRIQKESTFFQLFHKNIYTNAEIADSTLLYADQVYKSRAKYNSFSKNKRILLLTSNYLFYFSKVPSNWTANQFELLKNRPKQGIKIMNINLIIENVEKFQHKNIKINFESDKLIEFYSEKSQIKQRKSTSKMIWSFYPHFKSNNKSFFVFISFWQLQFLLKILTEVVNYCSQINPSCIPFLSQKQEYLLLDQPTPLNKSTTSTFESIHPQKSFLQSDIQNSKLNSPGSFIYDPTEINATSSSEEDNQFDELQILQVDDIKEEVQEQLNFNKYVELQVQDYVNNSLEQQIQLNTLETYEIEKKHITLPQNLSLINFDFYDKQTGYQIFELLQYLRKNIQQSRFNSNQSKKRVSLSQIPQKQVADQIIKLSGIKFIKDNGILQITPDFLLFYNYVPTNWKKNSFYLLQSLPKTILHLKDIISFSLQIEISKQKLSLNLSFFKNSRVLYKQQIQNQVNIGLDPFQYKQLLEMWDQKSSCIQQNEEGISPSRRNKKCNWTLIKELSSKQLSQAQIEDEASILFNLIKFIENAQMLPPSQNFVQNLHKQNSNQELVSPLKLLKFQSSPYEKLKQQQNFTEAIDISYHKQQSIQIQNQEIVQSFNQQIQNNLLQFEKEITELRKENQQADKLMEEIALIQCKLEYIEHLKQDLIDQQKEKIAKIEELNQNKK